MVYYLPILTSPVKIDTTCGLGFPTVVATQSEVDVDSKPFPNPFSSFTEIRFKDALRDASLSIYNIFGQRVRATENISGNRIGIGRENLGSGIYIYEVTEKGRRIGNGKLVVE